MSLDSSRIASIFSIAAFISTLQDSILACKAFFLSIFSCISDLNSDCADDCSETKSSNVAAKWSRTSCDGTKLSPA